MNDPRLAEIAKSQDANSGKSVRDDPRAQRLLRAWKTPTGWRYWSAVNNSEIGLWYTLASFAFFLFGSAWR